MRFAPCFLFSVGLAATAVGAPAVATSEWVQASRDSRLNDRAGAPGNARHGLDALVNLAPSDAP